MTEFEKVLMNRDGESREEARRQKNQARAEIMDIIESGGSYDEVEEMLMYDYGLEMDYIFDLM